MRFIQDAWVALKLLQGLFLRAPDHFQPEIRIAGFSDRRWCSVTVWPVLLRIVHQTFAWFRWGLPADIHEDACLV